MLKDGLYEQLINENIKEELKESEKFLQIEQIDKAESSKILAKYVQEKVEEKLSQLKDNKDLSNQIDLVNKIISTIDGQDNQNKITQPAEQLLALFNKENSTLALDNKSKIVRPETSIAQSSLFTGAIHEPQLYSELKKEIKYSNQIDLLISFIKWSGLRLIINELKEFTQNGGKLRVITTSYMGATDLKAIEELSKLPNTEIKINYDTKHSRLHAKTYVFYRDTGFSTAYVGSSNLSGAAITSGLEWNVKITQKDLPETIQKINATFESYWNADEFATYSQEQKEKLNQALKSEKEYKPENFHLYSIDVKPYPYQQEILDQLEAERKVRGKTNNLVVAATGTGKTIISALDYKRFIKENPGKKNRLLFIAHREEILRQSLETFRTVLKDPNFGDLFVGNYKPENIDHLFMSIQTFNSQNFNKKVSPNFYDYIIVDEFHHAAATSYQKLLSTFKPKILLGLTATPERMDGKNILEYFDNRIAAEIRLPEAIDKKLLSPFQYFGISDNIDLDSIKWSRGRYDINELNNVYTLSGLKARQRADLIISSLDKYVTDLNEVKGLGFCVSQNHAKFMSDFFNENSIPSIYLTGNSSDEIRFKAKEDLINGKIKFIFVVDIYNEGVDIPEVNTVLFLRPTESLTIFLQQLGRGLRLADDKECLTVLDFIGQANRNYNFAEKFSSLLMNTSKGLYSEVKEGFNSLPKGCFIQLERKSEKVILDNIKNAYSSNSRGLINNLISFEETSGLKPTLKNFLNFYNLSPDKLYKFSTFSRLNQKAKNQKEFSEPIEKNYHKALSRLSSIDSRRWIEFLLRFLSNLENIELEKLNDLEKRMFQMFYTTIWKEPFLDINSKEVKQNLKKLEESPVLLQETIDLLNYNYGKIDFIDQPVDIGFNSPLDLYCTYTRDQILVALDFDKPSTVREGVKWLPDKGLDVLFVTLNKSEKDYSPTTMYNDYSINSNLFHWQSQSNTSVNSDTGKRYIHHKENGSKVLLFVREFKNEPNSGRAAPYTFLGTANYVSHQGEKPMNIIWKLDNPIPAKYLKKTNKLMIG